MYLALPEYDAAKVNGVRLEVDWVRATALRLLAMSPEERKKIPGMDVRRADVIAGATVLLSSVMQKLCLSEVTFSDMDNLEGYLFVRDLI